MADIAYVYIALLDVLGYRARLNADRASGTLSFKDDLQNAMTVFQNVNEADFQYQAISDTIIISCSRRDAFKDKIIRDENVFLKHFWLQDYLLNHPFAPNEI